METKEEHRIAKDYSDRQTLIKDIGVNEYLDRLTTSESMRLSTEIINYIFESGTPDQLAEIQRIKEEFILDNYVDLR